MRTRATGARFSASVAGVSIASRPLLHAALIAVVTLAAYTGSFSGQFVSDDAAAVRDNPVIRALDWPHVRAMFTSFDDSNYIPIKVLSLAIDRRLWGTTPTGYHATNLAIHVGGALVIYALLLRLRFGALAACLTALLWAVHPLQVESVAWISERKNVLSGLFFFLAFHRYLVFVEQPRPATYAAVLGLFVLAVLSKMNTMVLPALCLAHALAFRFRLQWRDVWATLPMFGIAAVVGWYNLSGNPIHGALYHGGSALVTWLSSAVVVFRYLGNVFVPAALSIDYEVHLYGAVFDPPVLAAVLALLAIGCATVWLIRTRQRAGFWVLWFFITLAPMLNIIPFRSMMNDRYMYLALLGPLALIGGVVPTNAPGRRRRAVMGAAAVAIVGCVWLTTQRVAVWASPFALWKDGCMHTMLIPADPVYVEDEWEAKVRFLRAAAEREPTSARVHNNLGGLYYEAGENAPAIAELEQAARLDPTNTIIALNLAEAYVRANRVAEATPLYASAVARDPYFYLAHMGRLRGAVAAGDVDTARRELDVCDRMDPQRTAVMLRRATLRALATSAETP